VLIALFNLSEERQEVALAAQGTVTGATRLLATNEPAYVPDAKPRPSIGTVPTTDRIVLAPASASLFKVGQ
jgi:hypothetical protein